MNVKTTVPLAVAVVLGLAAAIVANKLVVMQPKTTEGGVVVQADMKEVVVAARDIIPGKELMPEDLTVTRMEAKTAPTGVPPNPAYFAKRVTKAQIVKGQAVTENVLAEQGASAGLSGVIKPGMRAMSIEINEVSGVGGFVQPGNRIDVVARMQDPEGGGQMTKTIAQNIEVLAVGSTISTVKPEESSLKPEDQNQTTKAPARNVTLLVTPQEAEKIDLAMSGQSRLVLRSSKDNETANVSGVTQSDLRNATSRARDTKAQTAAATQSPADDVFAPSVTPVFKPAKAAHRITVIRAGVPSEVEVEETSSAEPPLMSGGNDLAAP